MKSKISFFNKTIFLKNVTLYWPIWAGYLMVLLGVQPVMLWGCFEVGRGFAAYTAQDKFNDLVSVYQFSAIGWIIIIAAVVTGMALYSYIYKAKSANMIHALPVDKTQLFGTNVISGLAFLIVPQLIAAVTSAGVCLAYGVNRLDIIGIALIVTIGMAFVAYAIVTACAMFTGLLVAVPLYVFIVDYLGRWVYYMLYIFVSEFAYGVSSLGSKVQTVFEVILAPFSALGGYIGFREIYENKVCVGMEIFGGELLAIYVVAAIVLYVIAYFTYKKRHIEKAGEWITVEWLKPVFRFGVGTSAGIFGGLFIRVFLEQIGIRLNNVALVILILTLGGIGFFLADMIVRKNFHVFQKKNWIRCGIFSVILLVWYAGLHVATEYAEKYVPEKDEVSEVAIHMGYDIELDGEMADRAIDIHEIIIENIDALEAKSEAYRTDVEPFQYFYISYRLKNGEHIDRHYSLYEVSDEIKGIMEELDKLESDPEIFLQNKLCKRYGEVTKFGESNLELQLINSKHNVGVEDPNNLVYESLSFSPEQTKALYEAVVADVRSGALLKYNTERYWKETAEIKDYNTASLYLRFQDPDDAEKETLNFSDYSSLNSSSSSEVYEMDQIVDYERMNSVYIAVGRDCENILNKLIEFGYIESIDDVFWGEFEK